MQVTRKIGGVILGLFVLWQLLFLPLANLLRMMEGSRLAEGADASQESVLSRTLQEANTVGLRWGELTGQPQQWSMFAPSVSRNVPFLSVELRWSKPVGDADWQRLVSVAPGFGFAPLSALRLASHASPPRRPVVLLSENEPPDVLHYFKFGKFRLRRYEGTMDLVLRQEEGEPTVEAERRWSQYIEELIRRKWDIIRAYLSWRLRQYLQAHPEEPPPTEVILNMRLYRIPPPNSRSPWNWDGPTSLPVAGWAPGREPQAPELPVLMYDPAQGAFRVLTFEE